MSESQQAAAPESGNGATERSDAEAKLAGAARRDGEHRPTGTGRREGNPIDVTSDSCRVTDVPTFEQLLADPEIAALLDFEPVPRSHAKANGWTADMQRMFIAWLAYYGSPTKACDELGKARSGIDKVYKSPDAAGFRASWHAAVALAEKRRIARVAARHGGAGALRAPAMSRARADRRDLDIDGRPQQPGQVLNEFGEWEDEESYVRRAEEAKDSIGNKLVRSRRLYLMSISKEPVKRAAFEILTELPVDWDIAARNEPQPFEPWTRTNAHEPDMVLTAESGWLCGEIGYGPDKKAELRQQLNDYREAQGLPPIDWSESAENSEQA